jgi:glycosyl hydrolase family 26
VTGKGARVCACALLALTLLTGIAVARAGAGGIRAATCGTLLPPRAGAYLGAFPGFNRPPTVTEDDVQAAKIADFERRAGRRLAWVYFTQSWYRGLAFPRGRVLTIWRSGAVPYIAFLPHSGVFYGSGRAQAYPESRFTLQRIIDGGFDHRLRAWARAARDTSIPLLLSFGAEVNDDWGPWSATWNGAGETTGYGDPTYPDGAERFRDAYRHVVTLFRAEGATNVTWFFHADTYAPQQGWNTLDLYYPGDAYVDWLGISDYGSLSPSGPVVNFVAKLDASGVYPLLTRLSTRPMAVVEMGVVDGPDRVKPEWIHRTFIALRSGRYPRIRGAVWWDWRFGGIDTRIDSSPAALAAFRAGVKDRFFAARPRFTGTCAPATPRGLSASEGTGAVVRLGWSPISNAAWYEVVRNGVRIAVTAVSRYEDPAAESGHRYRYAVRAVNPLGRSGLSRVAIGFRTR